MIAHITKRWTRSVATGKSTNFNHSCANTNRTVTPWPTCLFSNSKICSKPNTVLIPSHDQNVTARWARGMALEPPINALHMEAVATVRQQPYHLTVHKLHQADCAFCELPVDLGVVLGSGEWLESPPVEAPIGHEGGLEGSSRGAAGSGRDVVVPQNPSYSPGDQDEQGAD